MNTSSPELITAHDEASPVAEAYRALQFKLFPRHGERLWSLGVTGVAPSHGSTTTAANLGLIVAESGMKVTLIDADLHKPCLHRHFELSNDIGFSTVLRGEISLDRALQSVKEPSTLRVLTAGPAVKNPTTLLQPDTLRTILARLREHTSFVIVDMPSLGTAAYTSFIASFLDGLLLVVRAGTSPVSADQIVKRRLQGVNVIGMVLNQVPAHAGEVPQYRHNGG